MLNSHNLYLNSLFELNDESKFLIFILRILETFSKVSIIVEKDRVTLSEKQFQGLSVFQIGNNFWNEVVKCLIKFIISNIFFNFINNFFSLFDKFFDEKGTTVLQKVLFSVILFVSRLLKYIFSFSSFFTEIALSSITFLVCFCLLKICS